MILKTNVERVIEAAPGLHSTGPLSGRALKAVARHCRKMELRHTAETGCGASTLLFSHLSEEHTVFASAEDNDSLVNVKGSSLLRPRVVTFIEGPSQATLPKHGFEHPLDCVLPDGPHGYPFPDLEYYFFYPHLSAGALLIVDDIHIPTVHNLFQFLAADAMFDLVDTVGSTAIFHRTDSPLFDPYGDGWWLQRFNHRVLLRYSWRQKLKQLLPQEIKSGLRRMRRRLRNGRRARVSIGSPPRGQRVGSRGAVSVVAKLPEGGQIWVFVRRKDMPGWWPQGGGPLAIENGGASTFAMERTATRASPSKYASSRSETRSTGLG